MIDFANWLRAEIRQRGLTNRELARQMGVDPGTVSRVLNGERQAGPDFCTALAEALGLDPAHVFRLAGLLPPLAGPGAPDPCLAHLLELASQLSAGERRRLVAVAEALLRVEVIEQRTDAQSTGDGDGTKR